GTGFCESVIAYSNSFTSIVVDCGRAQTVVLAPPGLGEVEGGAAGRGVVSPSPPEAATATPTPISPFVPAAAWPGTVHRNSYLPFLERTTVRVADSPGLSTFVRLPRQAFLALLEVGVVQSSKPCFAVPAFVTLKMIVPAGSDENLESATAWAEA